jgi:hypothetical protein
VFTHAAIGLTDRLPEGANLPRSLDPTAIHHLPETLRLDYLMPSVGASTPCSCWPRALWCWHLRCRGFYVKRRCAKGMVMSFARWRYAYRAYNFHHVGRVSAAPPAKPAYNLSFLLIPFRFLFHRFVVDIVIKTFIKRNCLVKLRLGALVLLACCWRAAIKVAAMPNTLKSA